MSSTPTRRRRVTALVAATAVVAAAAAGTTSALFTDREVVDDNSFVSGHLDLEPGTSSQMFTVAGMAPGDTVAYPLTLTNAGTVDLTWTPSARVAGDGVLAHELSTSAFTVPDAASCTVAATPTGPLLTGTGWTDLAATLAGTTSPDVLTPGDVATLCIQVGFNRDATIAYSGATTALEWVFDAVQADGATVAPEPDPGQIMMATYSTALSTCSDGNVTLPISGVVDGATIDWGDGTVEPLVDNASHTYATTGEHQVTIDGQFDQLGAGGALSDQRCIISVERWDDGTGTTSISGAFNGAMYLEHVEEVPSSATDLSYVLAGNKVVFDNDVSGWDVAPTTLVSAFNNSLNFDADLSHWDTSNLTSLSNAFFGAASFNGDVSTWDTSSLTNATQAFMRAPAFDQDLSGWDVSKVTNASSMFREATSFNGDVTTWDTGSVSNLSSMFYGARSFNQPIGAWDTGSAGNLSSMFYGATSFNQDIGNWDTSSATLMSFMFRGATSFNQDISRWDVSKATQMVSMFQEATSFNQDLSAWRPSPSVIFVNFEAGATSWVLPKPTWA